MPHTAPFGAGLSRLCAVVAAPTSAEMISQVHLALRDTSTIELRLDYLANDAQRVRFLNWLRRHRPSRARFIATCRRRRGGGLFKGTAATEINWLKRAREAGCLWCDLELETYR